MVDDYDGQSDDDDDNFPLPSTCVSCNPCVSGFKPGLLLGPNPDLIYDQHTLIKMAKMIKIIMPSLL